MRHLHSKTMTTAGFVLVCALIITLAGCSGKGVATDSDPEPKPTEVVLDAEGAMEVALDYNAGTGYEWECTLDPEGVLMIVDR